MEAREEDTFDIDGLFESTMKKNWKEVVWAYQKNPKYAHKAITKSEDTALHIAVSSYHAESEDSHEHMEWVRTLVNTFSGSLVELLGSPNDQGDTPLHFAAALGSEEICECIAAKDHKLLDKRNHKRETPFFCAAKHGKLEAFLCLCKAWEAKEHAQPDETLFRRNDGCNILHAAISGEYFELADHIITNHKTLIESKNVEGSSPLHILATKPGVFNSSSNLRLCDRIVYNFIIVHKQKVKALNAESDKNGGNKKKFPDNYETCVNLMQKSLSVFKIILASNGTKHSSQNHKPHTKDEESQASKGTINSSQNHKHPRKDEESQEEDMYEGSFPPNYATCIQLFKFVMNFVLIILGIGVSRIKKIRQKKEKHTWANQIMENLIRHEKGYKYSHNGQAPAKHLEPDYADIFAPPDTPFDSSEQDNQHKEENNIFRKNEKSDMDKPVQEDRVITAEMQESWTKYSLQPDAIEEPLPEQNFEPLAYQERKTLHIKKETPILVAAKMGITEMVDKILETFPVAIQDVDEQEKNALLLAIEHRQTKVYDLLTKKKLPESVLYQVDHRGNSALHLAATFQYHQPWRIPGAALQMQWEIKWFKHVKHTMPAQYLVQYQKNDTGESARQIFTRTHKKLVKDGSEWLIKTSESCSLVAALIATVAFATSTTVPGGNDDRTGSPLLEGQLAFDIFSIGSLVALCFSVTALVFFLAILTSRCQEQDFVQALPQRLLLGLSSLFTSIAGMLLSFCAGHFFVLQDELHSTALLIYAITCLPITFFAFAQLPLYLDLLWSIIRKIPLRSYKAFSD